VVFPDNSFNNEPVDIKINLDNGIRTYSTYVSYKSETYLLYQFEAVSAVLSSVMLDIQCDEEYKAKFGVFAAVISDDDNNDEDGDGISLEHNESKRLVAETGLC